LGKTFVFLWENDVKRKFIPPKLSDFSDAEKVSFRQEVDTL